MRETKLRHLDSSDLIWSVGNIKVGIADIFWKAEYGHFHEIKDKILTTVFMCQSVRTRVSFESAALQLGMKTITVNEQRDGEPWEDFGYAVACSSDVIVTRLEHEIHTEMFSLGAEGVPVIDGGTGTLRHPTQALIDVYTMLGDDIPIGSKIGLFSSPENRAGRSFRELASRFWVIEDYNHIDASRGKYSAIYATFFNNRNTLDQGLKIPIYHPFPRGGVVPKCYDNTEVDRYHTQMDNAVVVRKALLCHLF